MQRTRECNGPSYGGSECRGDWRENSNCFLKDCPGMPMPNTHDRSLLNTEAVILEVSKFGLINMVHNIYTDRAVLIGFLLPSSGREMALLELLGQLQQDMWRRKPAEAESV